MADSNDLLHAVLALDEADGGLREGESLVVGFSGGVDSVALLDLLHRATSQRPLRLVAAHLDHGLRSASADDALFCARFCTERGIPLRTHRIEAAALDERRHVGLEGAAREVRRRWLEQVRVDEGCDRIALAHHLDDHAETLLVWMLRGTGLTGLRGIRAAHGRWVRPLRSFSRASILDYVTWRGMPWREDESNQTPVSQRNRLRHEVMPRLREIFGSGAPQRLAGSVRRASADLAALEALAEAALVRCQAEPGDGRWRMRRAAFCAEPQVIQMYLLRRILEDAPDVVQSQRWNEPAYQRVLSFAVEAAPSRKMPLPGGGWLHAAHDELEFELTPQAVAKQPDQHFELIQELLPPVSDGVRFEGVDWACFDADRIEPPVRLTRPVPGDRMRTRGRTGHKKLSTLFREHRIPLRRRPGMPVVRDARRILWIAGVATAHETAPTPATKQLLRLTLRPIEASGDLGTDSACPDR
jgi:tRNA(Ile)-lysidine synthase